MSEVDQAVKTMGGPAAAIRYVMRVLAGQSEEVQQELMAHKKISGNQLALEALYLRELEHMPVLGKLHNLSKGDLFLEKILPDKQPGNLRAELADLQRLSDDCSKIGLTLGGFYVPLGQRKKEVELQLQHIQDEQEERLLEMQVQGLSDYRSQQLTDPQSGRVSLSMGHRQSGQGSRQAATPLAGLGSGGGASYPAAGSGRGRR